MLQKGALVGCENELQPRQRRRRHLHQRHVLHIGQRHVPANAEIAAEGADYEAFCAALNAVTTALCRQIARDGEGATKLIECSLTGAKTQAAADSVSKAVICSSLVKAAMFGADANLGPRIVRHRLFRRGRGRP